MGKTSSHRQAQTKAAGKTGRTEVPLRSGRILDAATKVRAIEVERSGRPDALRKAADKLKESGKPQRVLIVPQRDITKATKVMREVGITGTVKNLSGTKHSYVGAKSGTPKYEPVKRAQKK